MPTSGSVEEEDKTVAHAVGIATGVEDDSSQFAHTTSGATSSVMVSKLVPALSSHSQSHTPAPGGAWLESSRGEAQGETSDSGGRRDACLTPIGTLIWGAILFEGSRERGAGP